MKILHLNISGESAMPRARSGDLRARQEDPLELQTKRAN
jgi:hypothetical protein